MAYIEITNLRKTYTDANAEPILALDGISLSIDKGEFVSIFGPNGCGKSTLLNAVADLVPYDSGDIEIGGKPPSKARIGFVFQRYSESLFPWLKNIDNICFGLDSLPSARRDRREHARQFLDRIGLKGLPLDKYPYQCSAGQQQLVALARELVCEPDVLLMDEPFVSLDYERRLAQHEYLLKTLAKTRTTVMFVSHEIDEAIYVADRLVLLSKRPGTVRGIYDIPFDRPRQTHLLEDPKFHDFKIPILHEFREMLTS